MSSGLSNIRIESKLQFTVFFKNLSPPTVIVFFGQTTITLSIFLIQNAQDDENLKTLKIYSKF